ncbi:MAG: DNA mismatch repair endonuclease MutL [Lachnospiraceae bacterium]|nr:DNA mismatch repair endonuclease MutL [Lachnospiraceae bacterium]
MSDVIRLLPDSVANQIAAGEVIQRPSSVIKELVENAVDAGATIIKIILKDAGRTLIQIVDNGCGMSATDARLAFERHSTSKIVKADDLFALSTMGFRGEALASICAVARVELRTMRKDDVMGTSIVIEGSRVESQEPAALTPGSNFMVKNLFFNVPARRKFLKSDQVEMGHILREFERMALVNPSIEFELVHNDVVLHQLLPSTLKQRIVALFGKSMDKQLVPVSTDTSLVGINGFVSRPENARKRGALQYFMVNGRNMRHPYFHKAVLSCYEQLIPAEEQPCYFINLSVDPATIDVNIHPTKSEIKFEEEQAIWKILAAAIKEGLGRFNAVPSIEFDLEDAPEIPVFNPNADATHELKLDTSYDPFKTGRGATGTRASSISSRDWESLYKEFERNRDEGYAGVKASTLNDFPEDDVVETRTESTVLFDEHESAPDVMQLKNRYILSPSKSGLMVVDQHRAHVRVLYEKYMESAQQNKLSTQRVIFPEAVELSASQSQLLESLTDTLSNLGFELTRLGNNAWEVNGVPSVMNDVNPQELLLAIVETADDTGKEVADTLLSRLAGAMANVAAIKSGQPLSTQEMERLLSELLRLATPNYTHDGKLVLKIITTDEIGKMFM